MIDEINKTQDSILNFIMFPDFPETPRSRKPSMAGSFSDKRYHLSTIDSQVSSNCKLLKCTN